jgi:hypothetical protein
VGWRSVFWLNVPVVVAVIVLTARFVPESRAPRARRFAPAGQLLVVVLLSGLTAVSGMPVAQAGVAAGVASTSRQVGSALGVAVLGSLVTSQLATSVGDIAAAARPAWVVVIACGLVVVALGVVGTTERARATARRTAERFVVPAPAVAPTTAR